MEKRKNLRFNFSKIFRSSFSYSCKTQNTPQVLDYQTPIPSINHSQDYNSPITTTTISRRIEPNEPSISSKTKYASIRRPPRCPETFDGMIQESRFLPNHKISSTQPSSPTVSPAYYYPLMNYYLNLQAAEAGMVTADHSKMGKKKKKKKKKTTGRRKKSEKMKGGGRHSHLKKSNKLDAFFHNPMSSSNDGDDWFSGGGEYKSSASLFFSSFSSNSRSFPSSDSDSNPPQTQLPNRRRRSVSRRRNSSCEVGLVPLQEEENVEGEFAVEVKSSSDPYGDFRESMLEMIVERRIFGAQELEKLLECFLHVNSHHHHKLIVEVFAEILETLFPRNGDHRVHV